MKLPSLKLFNVNCEGEIGDVVISGKFNLKGDTLLEQSRNLLKDQTLRNFLFNEPRGWVSKHFNLIVPPKNKNAKFGFIILEPEDNPPMSGSNSICVSTVLLEKNFIQINEPITEFILESPGGIIPIKAYCEKKKVKFIEIQNLPSFVDQLDVKIKTPSFGEIKVSTVFGGDSFIICEAESFGLKIIPENAKRFVEASNEIIKIANNELGFHHPTMPSLNCISFCQFIEPTKINHQNQKEGFNTVCIRPGKLDRSPCGTGTSARLALMRAKNEINVSEKYISRSIIGSKFEAFIIEEFIKENKKMIIPSIKGSAFITGNQEIYVSDQDPFPQGYRLSDTWPNKS